MSNLLMARAQEISTKLRGMETAYHVAALEAFQALEELNPETAKLALETFDDRDKAARWFAGHVGSLGGETPWERMAKGDVQRVRWVLNAIVYGIPP